MHRSGLSDHLSYTADSATNVWKAQWGTKKEEFGEQCLKDPYEQHWAKNLGISSLLVNKCEFKFNWPYPTGSWVWI